jgi:hypothetical protein
LFALFFMQPLLLRLFYYASIATICALAATDSAFAQLPSPSATPIESPPPIAPPSLGALDTCTAAVTFASGQSLSVRSTSDVFPLIAATAGETFTVQLRFPLDAVGALLGAQPLDGGAVFADNLPIALDGSVSIQFQVGSQPGLYRLPLEAAGQITTLQFWVLDLDDPSVNPPALQPE